VTGSAGVLERGAAGLVRPRLIVAEILKLRTTAAWWLFGGGFIVVALLAAALGWAMNNNTLHPTLADYSAGPGRDAVLAQAAAARTAPGAAALAASMLTSGQFLLVLITLLLGVHVVTSEYSARTVTATFLAEPRRSRVVAAKVLVCGLSGAAFWLIATVVDVIAAPAFLAAEQLPAGALFSATAVRAVATGLPAYVLWALFGLGLGALLRSQVVAVAAAIGVYIGGVAGVDLVIHLLYAAFHASWLLSLLVLAPAEASNALITAGRAFPDAPAWWVGGLVLTGYGVALTVAGGLAIRRSDIA
jgi:ABC-type transport system involved in multi-copper enzyme maturation permease subunit